MDRVSHSRAVSRGRLPIAAALSALLCALALSVTQAGAAEGEEEPPLNPNAEPPSFVVIQTDDQTLDGLYATFSAYPGAPETRAMPNTLDLIGKRGMAFNRYYVSYPLCCPSRVSLMTGRYAHNSGVKGNVQPNGGYFGFSFRGAYDHNIATWLQGAGYRTIHIGKFLNGYGDEPYSDGRNVPPGWDAWHTVLNADTQHFFYGYTLNNDGVLSEPGVYGESGSWETREYGQRDEPGCPFAPVEGRPCVYATDIFNWQAREEMLATSAEQPFYMQLDYTAPHGDFRRPAGPEPAPRHYNWFKGKKLPHNRSEGLDEGNVSDKPYFIREASHLTPSDKRTYKVYWDKQLESLRSIDDGVKEIVDTLGQLHRLSNTYVVFTSDNGFFFGEHRLIGGKFLAYEPATHMPFLIRGPGIEPGASTGELAANVDIAPTILDLAGVSADKSLDGRSLTPYLRDPGLRSRRPILFESFVETSDVEANGAIASSGEGDGGSPGGNGSTGAVEPEAGVSSAGGDAHASILAPPLNYEGIRLGPYKYIAWPSGEKELYDINRDPNELNNIVKEPNFYPIRNFLHRQLRRFENCVGRECREVTPPLPLTRIEFERFRAKRQKEIREHERQREKERRERERHKGPRR
ncbi:MAG TPA: sulfatase [Solirubrobacterales bacterium]|nr:sulfatase [Solirubrobacterales bacterium]